jgi:hypothetical protein
MDEELGSENRFFVSKDASGNPVYMHNNQVVNKDVFDRRSQASTNQINAMKTSVTPGIDDDPDIMAMKEKIKSMQSTKKPIKKAKGGTVSSASKRGDGIAQRGKTRGKMC